MGEFRTFLEASSIHGLTYISTTRSLFRIFWTLVVITGFTGAGFLIYESVQSWEESPVSTTVETLPITELTFPKVTVCPPKNTYTNLNYDLMMAENMTMDNDTRKEYAYYVLEVLQDHFHEKYMDNFTQLEEENRYFNWYHGFTEVKLPSTLPRAYYYEDLSFEVNTWAANGYISTKFFGQEFNLDNVPIDMKNEIDIYFDANIRKNKLITLTFEIETIKQIRTGETLRIGPFSQEQSVSGLDESHTKVLKNFTPPTNIRIKHKRGVPKEDFTNMKMMPGFKVKWYLNAHVASKAFYINRGDNKAFVRQAFQKFNISNTLK